MKTKDLADMIRKKRKEQKLTQPQLAGLCNVGVRFIVDLESGKLAKYYMFWICWELN